MRQEEFEEQRTKSERPSARFRELAVKDEEDVERTLPARTATETKQSEASWVAQKKELTKNT